MTGSVQREFSFWSWILQLLFAYIGPVLVLGVLESALNAQDTPATDVLAYVALAIIAVLAALLLRRTSGDVSREGSRVWIVPAAIEATMLIHELSLSGLKMALHTFFFAADRRQGEEMWVIFLLTLPTWSCCWYSAAMSWHRASRDPRPDESPLRS